MCWFGVWMAAAIAFGAGFIVCGIFCGSKSVNDKELLRTLVPVGECHYCTTSIRYGMLFCCKECERSWLEEKQKQMQLFEEIPHD